MIRRTAACRAPKQHHPPTGLLGRNKKVFLLIGVSLVAVGAEKLEISKNSFRRSTKIM